MATESKYTQFENNEAGTLTPVKKYDITGVENDDINEDDMYVLIDSVVAENGLVGHNLSSFNQLMSEGVTHILTQLFKLDMTMKDHRDQTPIDRDRKSIRIQFHFTDANVGLPSYTSHPMGNIVDLIPNKARISGLTYSAPLTLAAEVKLTATYEDGRTKELNAEIPLFQVSNIPVMVRSNRCHTHHCTREALKALEEDPNEPGGYFIAKGGEYVVELLENIRFNKIHIHKAMKQNEIVRGEFISQAGGAYEHSAHFIIRYMLSGAITIEINSIKFSKTKIPFYLIFRIFGMTSDRDILEQIVYDLSSKSPVVGHMLEILEKAVHMKSDKFEDLRDVLDREQIIQSMAVVLSSFVTNTTAYQQSEEAIKYLNDNLISMLDRVLLPHMGITADSRRNKLRFLGMMIQNVLLVEMGIMQPTDRDSYYNKRTHGAGVSIAKTIKTQFNQSVVSAVIKSLKREVKNTPFEELSPSDLVNAFKSPLSSSDLDKMMEQSITSGNKEIVTNRQMHMNRVSTQILERKNMLNTLVSLRTVTTHNASNSSKQTQRADMMRRVHPSYTGFICVAKSADTGENVGMSKELAITCNVCDAGEALTLKAYLLSDPAIIPLDDVLPADIMRQELATIFINGEWIGCCHDAPSVVARYRALRRESRIVDPRATITWDPIVDSIEFLLDVGRLSRPLLIVHSNIVEYKAAARAAYKAKDPSMKIEFKQNILLTKQHINDILAGRGTIESLRSEGILEFVSPEESVNCLISRSITNLREHRTDPTITYTHCELHEIAIFGLSTLISPYGNHTQPARVTYETNQGRQTCGWYAFNWPFRSDKNRFFQFHNEMPLVKTMAHRYIHPNGVNTSVAYMIYGGDNMEDSAIVNRASVDRGMFNGLFFRTEKVTLEKGEQFMTPDPTITRNMKPNASYEKLVDGFVTEGTEVKKGDVLIGLVVKMQKREEGDSNSSFQYLDRSMVYRQDETAIVDKVWKPRGANDELFGLVKLRYTRKLIIGDKMSSRSGNKSICARILAQSDMPTKEDGTTVDMIINPHSFPTRMTIGQLLETRECKINARLGRISDGTPFHKIDHDQAVKELTDNGFRYNGCERMFNGMTGEYFDAAIFTSFTYHQRLQKFVSDDKYAVAGSGPTDAVTGQPLGSKNARGGLRIGEMEGWTLGSQGAMMTLHEKFSVDSDGRKMYVCRRCGEMAIYNKRESIYICKGCGPLADITTVDSCQSAIVMAEELRSSNVRMQFQVSPFAFEDNANIDEEIVQYLNEAKKDDYSDLTGGKK